jgi:hypothetical protein
VQANAVAANIKLDSTIITSSKRVKLGAVKLEVPFIVVNRKNLCLIVN